MQNENLENENSINLAEETVNDEVELEVEAEAETEDSSTNEGATDDRDERLKALEKENQTLKIQKAKLKEKQGQVKEEVKTDSSLSNTDLYALIKNNVEEEDISEVVDYAKLKKVSVQDALKSNFIKTYLKERAEERNVATASNTGTAKRSSAKTPDDVLLKNLQNKGELPESEDDMKRLIEAELQAKRK
jgi:hypothetical protein